MKTRLVLIVETDPKYHTNPWEWDWSDLLLTKAYVDSHDILEESQKAKEAVDPTAVYRRNNAKPKASEEGEENNG